MTKDKKVQLDRTHTKGRGCERLFYCIRVDPRRSEEGGGGREERKKVRWKGWEVAKAVERGRKC